MPKDNLIMSLALKDLSILISNRTIRLFSLFFIIYQSLGIRLIEGQGWAILLILACLNIRAINLMRLREYKLLGLVFLILLINKFINPSYKIELLIYQFFLLTIVVLFLIQYKLRLPELEKDFFKILQMFVYHSLIGYFLAVIFPFLFSINISLNHSMFYFFYISDSTFMGLPRNTGLFWEPGIYQLIANFHLFFVIKYRFQKKILVLSILAVVTSFSTVGFIILLINLVFFYFNNIGFKVKHLISLSVGVILALSLYPIVYSNVSQKMDGSNTSGLIRLRDFLIGVELIYEKPILGHGQIDSEEMSKMKFVGDLENILFSPEFLDTSGKVSGGYTNGFLAFVVFFGMPFSTVVYLFLFNNKLIITCNFFERAFFYLIIILTLFSEPISITSFFYLFPSSSFMFRE